MSFSHQFRFDSLSISFPIKSNQFFGVISEAKCAELRAALLLGAEISTTGCNSGDNIINSIKDTALCALFATRWMLRCTESAAQRRNPSFLQVLQLFVSLLGAAAASCPAYGEHYFVTLKVSFIIGWHTILFSVFELITQILVCIAYLYLPRPSSLQRLHTRRCRTKRTPRGAMAAAAAGASRTQPRPIHSHSR